MFVTHLSLSNRRWCANSKTWAVKTCQEGEVTHVSTQGHRSPMPVSHLCVAQEKSVASTSVSLVPLHGQRNENTFIIPGGWVSSCRTLQSTPRVGHLGHGNLYLHVGKKVTVAWRFHWRVRGYLHQILSLLQTLLLKIVPLIVSLLWSKASHKPSWIWSWIWPLFDCTGV